MEVRLLLSYVREAHGGEFRVVAFSALLDTAERPDSQQKESNMQTTRVIRLVYMVHSNSVRFRYFQFLINNL